jgi:PKD repeat protein
VLRWAGLGSGHKPEWNGIQQVQYIAGESTTRTMKLSRNFARQLTFEPMIHKLLLFFCLAFTGLLLSCKDEMEEPSLTADFEAEVQTLKAGESVTFKETSDGRPSRWNWEFDGGTPATSNLSSPTVVYEQPGSYAVRLTISYGDKTATTEKESFITVSYLEVMANFEADRTTAIQGESIVFKDLSSGAPTSWSWEFTPVNGTPITSNEQHPTITFEEPGMYTVKLAVSNPEYAHEVTREAFIEVIEKSMVSAAFTSSGTATFTGGEIAFTDASIGTATAWEWAFEGGTPEVSAEQNPSVTYHTPGRYKVKLIASNPDKSSVLEREGYILVVPGADLAAFFPFNGDINDVGPHKLTSTQTGSLSFSTADRKSQADAAAAFDGASIIEVQDHNALNFEGTNFTVSSWVKTDRTAKMMVWQESGKNGSGDNQAWLRLGDNATDRKLRFAVEDSGGGAILNVGSEADVTDNGWHHVVCVREGSTTRVFIDGVQVKETKSAAVKDVSNEQNFKIGAQDGASGFNNFFTGSLDDMVIYNKALTPAEVSTLYNL